MSVSFLSRISIAARIYMLVALVGIGISALLWGSSTFLASSAFEQEVVQARNLAEAAASLMDVYYQKEQNHEMTREEAQHHAAEDIAYLRYNNYGYFWINDMDGRFVSHPIKDLVGRNAIEDVDAKGKKYMRSFIDIVKAKGRGVDFYYWPPSDGKLKVSYIIGFPKWGWILGTGVYVEQIENDRKELVFGLLALSLGLLGGLLILAMTIGQSITRPLSYMTHILRRVSEGDLAVDLNVGDRSDEIGIMGTALKVFIENQRQVARIDIERARLEKTRNDLVSVVSHELRTPLTSIYGALGLIRGTMKEKLSDQGSHLLEMAFENCSRLIALVNDLLDVDKTTAGELSVELRRENLGSILEQTTFSNHSYAEKYAVRLVCDNVPKDIHIFVDRTRLIQVLSNFLSNAVKFSPAGGLVRLTSEVNKGEVKISVIDYGLGISKEFQDKMFQKFSQADSTAARKKSGTGLGLYISKTLVELMDGEIGFETKEGFGTTFWVKFPLEPKGKETVK